MIIIIDNKPNALEYFKNDFQTICCNVEDFVIRDLMEGVAPIIDEKNYPLYFVSPSNSLMYFNGGIDAAYMRMFPNIEEIAQKQMRGNPNTPVSKLGNKFLPVGSSMLIKISERHNLISAPTMLEPQTVKDTQNAYYAMKAILKVWPGNGTLLLPILCGGCGQMKYENVREQIKKAISEHDSPCNNLFYFPETSVTNDILQQQPKYYENTEYVDFEDISDTDVKNIYEDY